MVTVYRDNFVQKNWRSLTLGLVAALGVGFAVWVGAEHLIGKEPPDPEKAAVEEVGKFIKSQDFLDMPSRQRGEYVDKVVNRHISMSPDERRAEWKKLKELKLHRRENREAQAAFWISWGVQRAEEFDKLSESEKDRYVDRWINTMKMLGGNREFQRRKRHERNPKLPQKDAEKRIERAKRQFARFSKQTTARERAKMMRLGRAFVKRMRERQRR